MINAMIAPLDPADSRVAARRLVNFGARVRSGKAGGSQTVVVADLSADGCRLLLRGAHVEEGAALWLKLPGIEARRTSVVWCSDSEAGCEFMQPLTRDEIADTRPVRPQRRDGQRSPFGVRS